MFINAPQEPVYLLEFLHISRSKDVTFPIRLRLYKIGDTGMLLESVNAIDVFNQPRLTPNS